MKYSIIGKQTAKYHTIVINFYKEFTSTWEIFMKVKWNKVQDIKLYLYFDRNYIKHNLYTE